MVKKVIIDFDEEEFEKHSELKKRFGLSWKEYLLKEDKREIGGKNNG